MKKFILVLFLIIATTTIQAELPYPNSGKHLFSLIGSIGYYADNKYSSNSYKQDKLHHFDIAYSYKEIVSVGLSKYYLYHSKKYDAITAMAIGKETEQYSGTYIGRFLTVNPLELFSLSSPISLSLQSSYNSRFGLEFSFYFYKQINLSKSHLIRPIISASYEEFYFSNHNRFGISILYQNSMIKNLDILCIPYLKYNDQDYQSLSYEIRLGVSYQL